MSVERQGGKDVPAFWLRLACDGDWCPKKFSPRRRFTDPVQLRRHALLYGWLTTPAPQQQPALPGVVGGGPLRDLCPECRRTTP